MEGREQAAGGQHQRAPRQDRALVIDPVQVATGHVSHADGTSRAVQKLVAVPEREHVLFRSILWSKFFFFLNTTLFLTFHFLKIFNQFGREGEGGKK